ncbi:MAG: hypothetical protein ACM3ZU_07990 [Bacteroidota bacterium]
MDLAMANGYFLSRLHSEAWDQATLQDREKALVTAERQVKTLRLRDDAPASAVSEAICEQALFLLSATDYQRKREANVVRGVIGGSVGDANEYSSVDIVRRKMAGVQICPEALSILGEYILRYRVGELR